MFIFYDLHFDGIDDVDDEHIGDFDAFPQDILKSRFFPLMAMNLMDLATQRTVPLSFD